ncbi:uncharacterized protein BXZ73DRAFT_82582 [Epithele typhae]|uniref:uncharacterized protein n=1 Tax=Epithele typhae TaxID=378194 RepID=UPI00200845D1|nr:uncharacterized protein BXZ73DRAFT_82582 [Epithele typhae]KAH9911932.1 hypothetical protein BXZ73DRAFT_82582 [Epithele typhae]
MSVHVGGFWFPSEAVHHLLTKAYGIRDVTPQDAPFTATLYFVDYDYLNCPSLIEHPVRDKSGKLAQGYVLVCRLAFVDDGLEVPDLSLDQSATACADHWFPPWLRDLEVFKDVRYLQYEYTEYFTIPIIYSKEQEYDWTPQRKRRPGMPDWLRKRHEWGRTFAYVPPGVPALYVYDDDNSTNTSDSDPTQPSKGGISQPPPPMWPLRTPFMRRIGTVRNAALLIHCVHPCCAGGAVAQMRETAIAVFGALDPAIRLINTPFRITFRPLILLLRLFIFTKKVVAYTCANCGARTCARRKLCEHPADRTCPAVDTERVLAIGRARGWKRCPACGHLIELMAGCSRVRCPC